MIDPNIPLVDLHRHLDGNIDPETIWDLAHKYGVSLPADSLEGLRSFTQIHDKTSDLLAFLAKLDWGVAVLGDLDACYRVAYENLVNAKLHGLDYVELRFSPFFMGRAFNLPLPDLVEAIADGVKAGIADTGVSANLIGILSRTFGVESCQNELEALLIHKDKIVALDLAGDELNYPASLFERHFKHARDAGWDISVHAGEADGPSSIWNAIKLLGATRIGHGVSAIHDNKLIDYMLEHNIVIESCPTSNYQTATVSDLSVHPLPHFLKAGLKVTLNTDDPGVSNIDIRHEYEVAHKVLGISQSDLSLIQRHGIDAAFISLTEKERLWSLYA
jgi:adenosine deaminase